MNQPANPLGSGNSAKNPLCLAVIPARGGSKRIPKKNTRELSGTPLIAYTIAAALKSGLFDRIIVTTDDELTAGIAEQNGAEVPFRRDAALADDQTPVSAATVDALTRCDPTGERYEFVCQLMANCPLRTGQDIRNSFAQLLETGAEAQISVVRYGWQNPWWAMERNADMSLQPLFEDQLTQRSQDLPPLFCPTGAIWWAKAEALRREGTFHMAGRTGWEMPWKQGIDIDDEDDWAMVELLARMNQGDPLGSEIADAHD